MFLGMCAGLLFKSVLVGMHDKGVIEVIPEGVTEGCYGAYSGLQPPEACETLAGRMKIGVLSDTHNHLPESKRALALLMQHGAGHLVHGGDAGEDVVDLISATCQEYGIRAHVAIGNCDHSPSSPPNLVACPPGIERGLFLDFSLLGISCAVCHGHDARRLEQAIESGSFDYLFTGHTHRRRDEQMGRTRVLNPGSCARPRGSPAAVLLLDLPTGSIRWISMESARESCT